MAVSNQSACERCDMSWEGVCLGELVLGFQSCVYDVRVCVGDLIVYRSVCR